MVSQSLAFKWAAHRALYLGLAGAAILESGQSRRKVLVRLRCQARKTAQSYRKCSATKLSDDWAPPRDGESGETWDRQALGEPCIRHAQNASGRWDSAKPRQSALYQKAGVDEGIADAVTVAHELGFEQPALRAACRHPCKLGNIKQAGDHGRLRRKRERVVAVGRL